MALDAFTFPASETHVPSSSSSLASRAVAAAAAQAAAAAAAAQAKTFVTLPFQRDLSQPTYGRSRHSSLDSGGAASFEVASSMFTLPFHGSCHPHVHAILSTQVQQLREQMAEMQAKHDQLVQLIMNGRSPVESSSGSSSRKRSSLQPHGPGHWSAESSVSPHSEFFENLYEGSSPTSSLPSRLTTPNAISRPRSQEAKRVMAREKAFVRDFFAREDKIAKQNGHEKGAMFKCVLVKYLYQSSTRFSFQSHCRLDFATTFKAPVQLEHDNTENPNVRATRNLRNKIVRLARDANDQAGTSRARSGAAAAPLNLAFIGEEVERKLARRHANTRAFNTRAQKTDLYARQLHPWTHAFLRFFLKVLLDFTFVLAYLSCAFLCASLWQPSAQ